MQRGGLFTGGRSAGSPPHPLEQGRDEPSDAAWGDECSYSEAAAPTGSRRLRADAARHIEFFLSYDTL